MITRQEELLLDLLKSKFDELKNELLSDFKASLLQCVMNEVKPMLEEKEKKITLLEEKVEELSVTVNSLQESMSFLKHTYKDLENATDDNEQYGRRLCLRIEGLEPVETESAHQVLEKLKGVVSKLECNINLLGIDRAHRIGKIYQNKKTNKEAQSVIVRFTTFRERTLLYKERKKIGGDIFIRLDLTAKRFNLLKKARDRIGTDNPIVKYAFADINCRTKIKLHDGTEKLFSSMEELKMLLE